MSHRFSRIGWAIMLAAAAMLPALHAQGRKAQKGAAEATSRGDWPMYNRDLAGTRYSPLAQVNTGNVARLTRAWSYLLGRDQTAGTLSGGSELTPIVVSGVMYVAASDRVVALEPETGKEIWYFIDGLPQRTPRLTHFPRV